jgi:hypothetical protein
MRKQKRINYNLKILKAIEDSYDQTFAEVAERVGLVRFSQTFVCTVCGKFLKYPVLQYYNLNVKRVKCYKCQKKKYFGVANSRGFKTWP